MARRLPLLALLVSCSLRAAAALALSPAEKSSAAAPLPDEDRKWLEEYVAPILLPEEKKAFLQPRYESCMQEIENEGHRFGEDLSEADKKAVTAFLATL